MPDVFNSDDRQRLRDWVVGLTCLTTPITFERAGRENGSRGLKNGSGDIDSTVRGIAAKCPAAEK